MPSPSCKPRIAEPVLAAKLVPWLRFAAIFSQERQRQHAAVVFGAQACHRWSIQTPAERSRLRRTARVRLEQRNGLWKAKARIVENICLDPNQTGQNRRCRQTASTDEGEYLSRR